MRDIIIGIDASTTAVKAIAFLRSGVELNQTRQAYPTTTPLPGHFEQDPEHWRWALLGALKQLAGIIDPARIAGLALAHQRETFTLIDAAGKALIPAILWLDERARPQVARLSRELGRETIRELSGKPPDPTPAIFSIAWLAQHKPEVVRQATALVDVDAYLMRVLTGRLATSIASADPLGLVDLRHGCWHSALVAAAGLKASQLPELILAGSLCGGLTAEIARMTGLPEGLPVIAGAGDGQAAGLGMGVLEPGKAYVSLGSGVVSGMFTTVYRTSDAFRTLTAPGSAGFMLETVLRSGMTLVDWIVRTAGPASVASREAEANCIAPGSDGLLVLPYWAGVMNPHWDAAARGAIVGLALSHTPGHLFRAVLEGIALEQAIATEAMEGVLGTGPAEMTVAGGGTNCRLLMQILASVLERPLFISPVNEAAALGAAMLAAAGVGWFGSAAEASAAMTAKATVRQDPDNALALDYRKRLAIYRDLYQATKDVHERLAALA